MVQYSLVWCSILWYGVLYQFTTYLFDYNDSVIMHLSLHDGMHMSQKYPQMLRTVSIWNYYSKLKHQERYKSFDVLVISYSTSMYFSAVTSQPEKYDVTGYFSRVYTED